MRQRVKIQSAKAPAGEPQPQKTALLFGAGYTALALVPHLQRTGYRVAVTSRDAKKRAALKAGGVEAFDFSPQTIQALLPVLKRADLVLSSAGPTAKAAGQMGDPILDVIAAAASTPLNALAPNLKWAGYLSATSVYGDRGGKWAFEDEYLYPTTKRGRARVEAELAWLETGWPVHVFRLAGIYGPKVGGGYGKGELLISRSPLDRIRAAGTARAVVKPGHLVNRIHLDDIIQAIMASIERPNPARVYNIADGHPAPPQDVVRFAARLLGLPSPLVMSHDDDRLTPMARSFYTECKRVDISRARRELGFDPAYTDYRLGLIRLAQAASPAQMWLAGHLDVPSASLSKVMALLPDHIAASRAEAGCVRFDAVQDRENPCRIHVTEVFQSVSAFDAHQARTHSSPWFDAARKCPRDYVVAGV